MFVVFCCCCHTFSRVSELDRRKRGGADSRRYRLTAADRKDVCPPSVCVGAALNSLAPSSLCPNRVLYLFNSSSSASRPFPFYSIYLFLLTLLQLQVRLLVIIMIMMFLALLDFQSFSVFNLKT